MKIQKNIFLISIVLILLVFAVLQSVQIAKLKENLNNLKFNLYSTDKNQEEKMTDNYKSPKLLDNLPAKIGKCYQKNE